MPDPMEIAPDIAILLAQTWKNNGAESIHREAVCRIWAFDMGWFDMETSIRVRDNLLNSGWIDENPQGVRPGIEISKIDIPFGWLPTMRLLENPPPLPKGTTSNPNVKSIEKPARREVLENSAPIDPASNHITNLLDQIATSSGLNRKEVMRRAQRKRRALGPITLWMALLLVAREQQLPMRGLLQTISS